MRMLFLTDGTEQTQSAVHRVRYFGEYLANLGHEVELFYGVEETGLGRRFNRASLGSLAKCLRNLRNADALVVHRAADPLTGLVAGLAKASGVVVLFDMDDAIYLNKNPLTLAVRRLIESSNAVIAASHAIAEFCRDLNANVNLVPAQVDTEMFRIPERRREGDLPVIGWMGDGRVHGDNLKLVVRPLLSLAKTQRFRMKLVSALGNPEILSAFKPLEDYVEIDYGSPIWSDIAAIPKQMEEFDISMMPLQDTLFNRGKAGQKLLESMGMGIPVVASPVGENRWIVSHGEDGFLASSVDQWVRYMQILIRDPAARARMGRAGRKKVENKYSRHVGGGLFAEVVNRISVSRKLGD